MEEYPSLEELQIENIRKSDNSYNTQIELSKYLNFSYVFDDDVNKPLLQHIEG